MDKNIAISGNILGGTCLRSRTPSTRWWTKGKHLEDGYYRVVEVTAYRESDEGFEGLYVPTPREQGGRSNGYLILEVLRGEVITRAPQALEKFFIRQALRVRELRAAEKDRMRDAIKSSGREVHRIRRETIGDGAHATRGLMLAKGPAGTGKTMTIKTTNTGR